MMVSKITLEGDIMSKTSGLAITSLVLGIFAFIFIWIPVLGQVLALLALIFGIIALVKIKKNHTIKGKALAIIGIVLAGVAIVYTLIVIIGAMAYFGVLNPGSLTPESCVSSTGTTCLVESIDDSKLNILFSNNLGSSILLNSSKISSTFGCKASMICPSTNLNCNQQSLSLKDSESAMITMDCPFKKGLNKIDLGIAYNKQSPYDRVATVSIVKNIK